jgi:hypothetical protein
MISRTPENKDAADRRSSKSADEPSPEDFGPDGTFHVMQAEMESAALDKEAGAENEPPAPPSVIHVMELQMKGEAVEQYLATQPGIDNELPEEPLPGKPPEPPLGGSREAAKEREERDAERRDRDRNGPGKRR